MEVYGMGGVKRTVLAPPTVAVGLGVTVAVPESERQLLAAVAFRLVTSNVVATRTPVVEIIDGSGVIIAAACAGFGTPASTTVDYTFAAGLSEWDQSNNAVASGPCQTVPLDAGDSLSIVIPNIDAGDQLSRVRFVLLQAAVRAD